MSVYSRKYGFMLTDLGTEAARFHIFSPRSNAQHLLPDRLDPVTSLSSARNPSPPPRPAARGGGIFRLFGLCS